MIKEIKAWAIITKNGKFDEPSTAVNISLKRFPKCDIADDEIQVPCTINYEFNPAQPKTKQKEVV